MLQIEGPDDSPYSRGNFMICITFPKKYPFVPFKLYFLTPILHPNIQKTSCSSYSKVCDCSIKYILKHNWSPIYNLKCILQSVCGLLINPELQMCISHQSAVEYNQNPDQCKIEARKHTLSFAVREDWKGEI